MLFKPNKKMTFQRENSIAYGARLHGRPRDSIHVVHDRVKAESQTCATFFMDRSPCYHGIPPYTVGDRERLTDAPSYSL